MKKNKKNVFIEIGSVALAGALIIGNLIKDALDKREQEEFIRESIKDYVDEVMGMKPEDEEESEEDAESEEDEEL